MTNVIKQIVNEGEYGAQTIKMVVRANERGATGAQGPQGLQGPQGIRGPRGFDGAIQYRAGAGIRITDDNIIEATSEAVAAWGAIQGNINNQTDLQQEFNQYAKTSTLSTVATSGSYNDLLNKPTIPTVNDATLTVQNDGTNVATFTANSSTNATANIVPPVKVGSIISVPNSTVQLADKNNASIYPLTNAVVDGTISTNSIADGAVTTAKIDSNAVTAAKIDLSTLSGNYSTSEVDTGFTWTNGSAIYKKTVDIGALPNATTKSVAHNISNFGVPVKLEGMCISNAGSGYPMNGARPSNNTLTVSAYVTTTNVVVETGSDRSDWTGYATIYYTKTS